MAFYTIRPNTTFTITKDSVTYVAGDSVDLTPLEFEIHKHKLEGSDQSYDPLDLGAGVDLSEIEEDIEDLQGQIDGLEISDCNCEIESLEVTNGFTTNLKNESPRFQDIIVVGRGGAGEIFLPGDPPTGKIFTIINRVGSRGKLLCNDTTIQVGEIYEIIYNGSQWLEI